MEHHVPLIDRMDSLKTLVHSSINDLCGFILETLASLQHDQSSTLQDQVDAQAARILYETAYVDLLRDRTVFEEEMKMMADKNKQTKESVSLNVGGKLFTTTLSVLRRHSNSMLETMFSGRHHLETDQAGNFFIDKDPKTFRYILDYLRTDKFHLPNSHELLTNQIIEDIDYFCLPQPEFAHPPAFIRNPPTISFPSGSVLLDWQITDKKLVALFKRENKKWVYSYNLSTRSPASSFPIEIDGKIQALDIEKDSVLYIYDYMNNTNNNNNDNNSDDDDSAGVSHRFTSWNLDTGKLLSCYVRPKDELRDLKIDGKYMAAVEANSGCYVVRDMSESNPNIVYAFVEDEEGQGKVENWSLLSNVFFIFGKTFNRIYDLEKKEERQLGFSLSPSHSYNHVGEFVVRIGLAPSENEHEDEDVVEIVALEENNNTIGKIDGGKFVDFYDTKPNMISADSPVRYGRTNTLCIEHAHPHALHIYNIRPRTECIGIIPHPSAFGACFSKSSQKCVALVDLAGWFTIYYL